MPPGVNWTEDAVRVLLQYLINNHGNVASFHPTALAQLRPQLQNHLDQASYTSMTGFKIRDKFGHMWRLAKPATELGNIGVLWQFGIVRFDQVELVNQFLPVNGLAGLTGLPTTVLPPAPPPGPIVAHPPPPPPGPARVQRRPKQSIAEKYREVIKMIPLAVAEGREEIEQEQRIMYQLSRMAETLETSTVKDTDLVETDDLETDFQFLLETVNVAVTDLLKGMGMPQNQPITLDLDQFFGPDIPRMLATLMGSGDDWKHTVDNLQELLSSQMQDKMSLKIFLNGLIGAMITNMVFNMEKTPDLTFDEWEMEVEIHFPAYATSLARLFDQQLAYVLPNRQDPSSLSRTDVSLPNVARTDYIRPDPLSATNATQQPIVKPQWHHQWMRQLIHIFGIALHIRANLCKVPNTLYKFRLPAFMEPCGQEDARVLMGLMPLVQYASYEPREQEGEEEGDLEEELDWQVLTEPSFIILSMK